MNTVTFEFDTVARKPRIVSDYLDQIREHFSVEDKALVFMRRRTGRSNVPVRKYVINNKGHFDLPFFQIIFETIVQKFPALQIKIEQNLAAKLKPKTIATELVQLKFEPRDYQRESALKALERGSGIIVLPTSAGKTLTIALITATALAAKPDCNVLILVPNIQLVSQTYGDFHDYGIDPSLFSRWTGDFDYQPTRIVIANNQILLSESQDKSVLARFDVVINDEVHKAATASKISKLIKGLKATHFFGLTGSLPENEFDVWTINRIFGPVIYRKMSLELRQDKFISKVQVVGLEITYKNPPVFTKPSMSDPTAGYVEETEWLHTNEFRNSLISKLINRLETNTLILVDRIVHGEHLLEHLKLTTDKQIHFIQGSVEVSEREKTKKLMEETSGVVCIAISNIFSTGISIKNLHNVVFASIGKARIKIIQSIGRSLRLHHSKQMATIFDIADVGLNYGFKHYEERKRIYQDENIPLNVKVLVES
jgi:superfamily II DNA or RNA helicase